MSQHFFRDRCTFKRCVWAQKPWVVAWWVLVGGYGWLVGVWVVTGWDVLPHSCCIMIAVTVKRPCMVGSVQVGRCWLVGEWAAGCVVLPPIPPTTNISLLSDVRQRTNLAWSKQMRRTPPTIYLFVKPCASAPKPWITVGNTVEVLSSVNCKQKVSAEIVNAKQILNAHKNTTHKHLFHCYKSCAGWSGDGGGIMNIPGINFCLIEFKRHEGEPLFIVVVYTIHSLS